MKLMIVDDHAGVRTLIRQVVLQVGDEVCECESGDEAVQRARDFQPDFVTMDIRMPGMAVFDAARALHRVFASARIIIVTSYDQPDFRRAAANAGVAGYVIKENLSDLPQVISSLRSDGDRDVRDCGGAGI